MQKRKGLTLTDTIVIVVVIALLLFLAAILMPPIGKQHELAKRVVCGANLNGLGTAMTVYANDYDDNFPVLPGSGPWSKRLGFDYCMKEPDLTAGRTITASWYLLVKYADVSPKSFICPATDRTEFDGQNPNNLDITELWDFGPDPHKHVSYVLHNPYGQYPADCTRSAAFAVAADMSPWFANGDFVSPGANGVAPQLLADDWSPNTQVDKTQIQAANSPHHDHDGQNVLFGGGHNSYEKRSDVGVKHDGIYTYQSDNDIRTGTNPTARDKKNDAKTEQDSFLAI